MPEFDPGHGERLAIGALLAGFMLCGGMIIAWAIQEIVGLGLWRVVAGVGVLAASLAVSYVVGWIADSNGWLDA